MYQNKAPIYEIISGASIAIAAFLLIVPGFITDGLGFLLLMPFSRKIIINFWLKKRSFNKTKNSDKNNIVEAEIIEDKNKKDDT